MSTLERTFQRGIAEGMTAGRSETILRVLNKRFGAIDEAVSARVRRGSSDDMDRWTDRMLEAKTLAEVFGEPQTD